MKNKAKNGKIVPRGMKTILPHGGLPENISPYLINLIQKTGGINGPIGKQFIAQPTKEKKYAKTKIIDPLIEDKYRKAPGLIYKYRGKIGKNGKIICYGRVLWTITYFCESYCRFCTRGREVGVLGQKPLLTEKQINQGFEFLKNHPEINEVILSGGDPLVIPKQYLKKIIHHLVRFQKQGSLDIIRIGTRLPISSPLTIKTWHYNLLAKIKNPYLMVHINHPAELTPQAIKVLNNFRQKSQALILSQTVLLKEVNDSAKILSELFVKMTKEGIRPYYVFQNDPVYWAKHFTVPIGKAIKIWQSLRSKLSGVAATARFVIDTPFGFGKIPIPEGEAWKVDYSCFYDFKKKKHPLSLQRRRLSFTLKKHILGS